MRSLSLCGALLVLLTSCQSWRVQPVTPVDYVRSTRPERIQVIRTDQTTVEMHAPVVVGDSLRGLRSAKAIRPFTVPLEEVDRVAIRKFSLGRTALMILSIGGGLFVYDQLMALNQTGF